MRKSRHAPAPAALRDGTKQLGRAGYGATIECVDKLAETELARALLAGETDAFERFVDHFRSKVFHYSWLMCGRPEDAEEVAQETLLKVFENFDQLREPERVRAWIFRIAKNACLMQRRKSVFAPAQELSLDELPPGVEVSDAAGPPDSELLRSE